MSDDLSSDRWKRIESLFADALERPPEHRRSFIEGACQDDSVLANEVISLMEGSEEADAYFSRLASDSGVPLSSPPTPMPLPGRVGNYRPVELLGRGGMGAVYLAERDDDEFKMRVALKLLPVGLDTEEARERFRRERQILARLQHPNIARLYDGGVTDDGTPYLVMEYVRGTPIDDYCDSHRLDIPARLHLFLEVCAAVDQAHRNLVVHRDLKPQNILVSDRGEVKLLDFGIAQALDKEFGDGRTLTLQARPMTLSYASPEQLRGNAVTTSSDVYQLGVVLYRLFSGRQPLPASAGSPGELEGIVREMTPPPPSSTADGSTGSGSGTDSDPIAIAAARGTSVSRLQRQLSGDLDRITLMALRKEPERRYPSVRAFAEDIERHLAGYPVSAQRDTLRYRLSRFTARHRAGVAAGVALGVSLIALATSLVWFSLTTRAQSIQIAREAENTEAVSEFLVDLFRVADPFEGLGDTLTVRTVLERGAEGLKGDSLVDPTVRSHLMTVVGDVYMALGLHIEAGELFEEALGIQQALNGPDDPLTAEALVALAGSYQERGRFQEADSLFRSALLIHERAGADSLELAAVWAALARTLRDEGQADSAKMLAMRALDVYRANLGPDHRETVNLMTAVAFMRRAAGELDSAEALYRDALSAYAGMEDGGGRIAAAAMNNLAFLLRQKDELQEAESFYRAAFVDYADWRTPPETQTLLGNLASVLWDQGKESETLETLSERLRLAREEWPDGDWRLGVASLAVGECLVRMGRLGEAEPYFRDTLDNYAGTLGPGHGWTLNAESLLGGILAQLGRYREAEPYLQRGFEGLLREEGPDSSYTTSARQRLVGLYEAWGKPTKADQYRSPSAL